MISGQSGRLIWPMDPLDDLVTRWRGGDAEAFTELVRRLLPALRCAVAARADSPELVDEIVQRTLITVHQRMADYRGPGAFAAWSKSIAINHLRDEWRSRQRFARLRGDALGEVLAQGGLGDVDDPAADAEAGRLAALSRCLERLQPGARRLLDLRYARGMPLEELARRSRRTSGALAMALLRLREGLRRCIGDTAAEAP